MEMLHHPSTSVATEARKSQKKFNCIPCKSVFSVARKLSDNPSGFIYINIIKGFQIIVNDSGKFSSGQHFFKIIC